jgi:glycosyltransferase involved in cell wall biosynthesis
MGEVVATVLHVAQPTDAGVARYVAALCADQAERGWDVLAACPESGWLPIELDRLGVRRLAWRSQRAPDARTLPEAIRLRRVLDRAQPDVVHLHSAKAGLAGRAVIRGATPTLFQPHGWSWLAARPGIAAAALAWERRAARWATGLICVGDGEAELGRRHGVTSTYHVIRTGVDLNRFQPEDDHSRRAARIAVDVPRNAPLAVCVGRLTRQKGQDVLLAAWPAVRSLCPDALLALVGDGDLAWPLQRHAPAGVVFVGPVEDVRPWYVASTVVALPSRWEGLPLTLLEALAVGRSVVGTDIPGIAGELPPGAGSLVPPDDPVALATALAHRLNHPDEADSEGEVGAKHVGSEADERRSHDELARITARLAARRVAGRPG